jgi:flagellin
MQINTNVAATTAYGHLAASSAAKNTSLERLSSGFRINKAADDAAGLVISEKLQGQVNGIKVAIRNAQDGIGVIQTADGALTEVTSILHRMRDLAMHAGNGATDEDARAADLAEYTELAAEIDRIAETTKFGATNLLDGSFTTTFNIGATAADGDVVDVTIESGTPARASPRPTSVSTAWRSPTLPPRRVTSPPSTPPSTRSPRPVASSVRCRTGWSTPSTTCRSPRPTSTRPGPGSVTPTWPRR